MKVLIKRYDTPGGANVWAYNLCSTLKQIGTNVELSLLPIKYNFIPTPLIPTMIETKIKTWIKSQKEQDCILHSTAEACAFSNGSPMVITRCHIEYTPEYSQYISKKGKLYNKLVKFYEYLSAKQADEIVCISKSTQKDVKKTLGFDSKVIYPGVNTDVFKPVALDRKSMLNSLHINDNTVILFFAGSNSIRKGYDLLPDIMSKMGDRYVLLTSTGLSSNDLIASSLTSDKIVQHKNIVSLGKLNQHDLIKVYNCCDIFLYPSRLEGFGLVVAEAMACGKPVVTTNVASLPELIIDGKGGFLCEKNNINDFCEKISVLANDSALREHMGNFNMNRVLNEFNPKKEANEYLKIYNSLLGKS